MVDKIVKKRNRIKKDLDYYKNLKKDIEKHIKELATKESVKKRKELYKKRNIIGKYFLDLFELEDEEIDSKYLGDVFNEFIKELSSEEKNLFNNDNSEEANTSKTNKYTETKNKKDDNLDDDEDDFYIED